MTDSDLATLQAVLVGPVDPEIVSCEAQISALRARLTVEVAGTLVCGTYRYTRVWAREEGQPWRVVAGHVSAVPDRGPERIDSGLD